MEANMVQQMENVDQPPVMQMAQQVSPAGFWMRFIATVIDGIIISALYFPLAIVAMGGFTELLTQQSLIPQIIQLTVSSVYYGYFYSIKGASLGKMVFNMKVVNVDTGANLSIIQAIFRETIGKLISAVILLIRFIMAGLRADKRALHDLITGSQVLKKM